MKRKRFRLITIVLALSFIVGLAGAARAAGFTDSGEIGPPYVQAVEEMAQRGVLNGFEDGSFRPNGTLTREQGAKIIAYMCLGETAAEALSCDKAPFDDVAAGRWSAPCIAWCAQQDILHGYGDGSFGPEDTLTGDQYAKMLLCALSLNKSGNYADGSADWYKFVREDARSAKLYTGDSAMETAQPITRAQAALLSWNALQAKDAAAPAPSGGGGGGGGSASPTPTPSTPTDGGDIELPEVP